MGTVVRTVRHAARQLWRAPLVAAAGILTLAIGIGACALMMSVISTVLLEPLPNGDPDRLVMSWGWYPNANLGFPEQPTHGRVFRIMRDDTRAFSALAAFRAASFNVGDGTSAERLDGIQATGEFFAALGADRGVLGRTLILNGEPYTIIGVLFMAGFGLVALVLAIVGVYGVIGYAVVQRRQEFAVRRALGAGKRDVLWLIVREGLALGAAGVAAGLALSVAAAFGLRHLVFGLSPFDPVTLLASIAVVVSVTLAASLVPAAAAARIEPRAALEE